MFDKLGLEPFQTIQDVVSYGLCPSVVNKCQRILARRGISIVLEANGKLILTYLVGSACLDTCIEGHDCHTIRMLADVHHILPFSIDMCRRPRYNNQSACPIF
jgi:hypothetical protein